ncbi:hypothetical protein PN836_014215 [Ningiella sp. W23]|uniref:hypothetical protein n=1 Tax=Ningiella sp. W23 TaxID=3023715 RepID=UPI00375652E3
MNKRKWMKKFLSKWALVMLGVALTITSAVISNYFIAKNNDRVGDWERDAANVGIQIEEIWENSRSLERRKDTAVLLMVSQGEHPQSKAFISDTLSMFGAKQETEHSYSSIQASYDAYKEGIIEQINEKFLIQQSYLEQAQLTKMDNDVLINIALCFQILGLILVLTKGMD